MSSARQNWLATHPYLATIARFQGIVDEAAGQGPSARVEVPSWERYAGDQAAGVPLLASRSAGMDFSAAAAEALGDLTRRVAEAAPPGRMADACREIREALAGPEERVRAIEWIAGGPEDPPWVHPGLLRFLAWTAARRVLAPVVEGSGRWSDEGRWGRGYCPTCGALPLSAQLAPAETVRPRFLACGCCRTRWQFRRIGCPFCGTEAQDRLGILQVEGEEGLRIDVCNECRGYLKTYTDEGDEALFLADWPTLHLDVLAVRRGFERVGASLYELPKDERRTEP
jgi:FdhE protein